GARANRRPPPDLARCRELDVTARLLVSAKRRRNRDDVVADGAGHRMRVEFRGALVGPASAQHDGENFVFTRALDPAHRRPPWLAVVPRSARWCRRARNNKVFRLDRLRPSIAAISSCDAPCAYASHNRLRSRGFSCASARVTSSRRATASALSVAA